MMKIETKAMLQTIGTIILWAYLIGSTIWGLYYMGPQYLFFVFGCFAVGFIGAAIYDHKLEALRDREERDIND